MSTRFRAESEIPRVAVTGFFARYFKSWDAEQLRFQALSANGAATLRNALESHFKYPRANSNQTSPLCDTNSEIRVLERELQHAALWDARKRNLSVDPQRVGVVFSSSKNTFAQDRVLDFLTISSDAPGNYLAKRIGARGPRLSPVAACATGSHTMIRGAQLIQDGYADVAICGAIEPVLPPLVLAAYDNMGALSKSGVMRPFDQKRDGFVPNVGAGCLILENAEKARERGAKIHGFLSGWAMNADATHMTAMCPSGDSIARAIEYSTKRADVTRVDYINAHGTATRLNDETEARGIFSAVGNKVLVSSTKPLTGHLLGAAGAVEAVISLMALREKFAPPTLNLENINIDCDLDLVVGKGRDVEIQSVLSLNYGFGGHIGALLFTKT